MGGEDGSMDETDVINRLRTILPKPQSASRDTKSAIAALRQFVRPRSAVAERCDLCGVELAAEHRHLIEPSSRQIACACDPCAILFGNQRGAKYRRVPRRVRYLPDFRLDDAQWEGLMLPIGLAFFFRSSAAGKTVAFYPSPAGATESLLDLESWGEIVRDNPALGEMERDVEALLVNRIGAEREYYLAPIDECYKLVGLIRTNWRGLSGGAEVWAEIAQFFDALKERSKSAGETLHA